MLLLAHEICFLLDNENLKEVHNFLFINNPPEE